MNLAHIKRIVDIRETEGGSTGPFLTMKFGDVSLEQFESYFIFILR